MQNISHLDRIKGRKQIEVTISICSPSYKKEKDLEVVKVACTELELRNVGHENGNEAVQSVLRFISEQNGYNINFVNSPNEDHSILFNSAFVTTKRFWPEDSTLVDWMEKVCTLFSNGIPVKPIESICFLDESLHSCY